MRIAALAIGSFVLVACAANGEMKVNASGDESSASASASASSDGETKTESTKTLAGTPDEGNAQPVQAQATATTAACPLQCYVAQKGRVTPQEEQRLTTDLSDALTSLRACGPNNSLTIRFDSGGQLTEFGVDAERGGEGSCVQAVRQKRPTVSYPGPSTLRCYERCGGAETRGTKSTRRRR